MVENGQNKEVIFMWNGRMEVPSINGTKCALTLHTGISVTDRVKINKQNK